MNVTDWMVPALEDRWPILAPRHTHFFCQMVPESKSIPTHKPTPSLPRVWDQVNSVLKNKQFVSKGLNVKMFCLPWIMKGPDQEAFLRFLSSTSHTLGLRRRAGNSIKIPFQKLRDYWNKWERWWTMEPKAIVNWEKRMGKLIRLTNCITLAEVLSLGNYGFTKKKKKKKALLICEEDSWDIWFLTILQPPKFKGSVFYSKYSLRHSFE